MKLTALTLGALAAVLVAAAPAAATTVSADGGRITIAAAERESNRITVFASQNGRFTIEDRRSPVAAGPGCTSTRPDRARCGGPQTVDILVSLEGRDDFVAIDDSVRLRTVLNGGDGDDTLLGGLGPDTMIGGPGRDTANYSHRSADLSITLGAGGRDDGAAGEGDELRSIERLIGGTGNDTLTGTAATDLIYGGPGGDDRLAGGGSSDLLAGGTGDDALDGGDGNDVLRANRTADGADVLVGGPGIDRADYGRRLDQVVADPDGVPDDGDRPGPTLRFTEPLPAILLLASPERDDVRPDVEEIAGGNGADVLGAALAPAGLQGGPGTDVLFGGPRVDRLNGNRGFDRIVSRDRARDSVRCGTEADRVFSDGRDRLAPDCEHRLRSFAIQPVPSARRLDGDGALRVRVVCPAQAFQRCVGSVRASTVRRVRRGGRARQVSLGSVRVSMRSGESSLVSLPFTDRGRSVARSFASLRVRLAGRGRDAAGPARLALTRLVLRGGAER